MRRRANHFDLSEVAPAYAKAGREKYSASGFRKNMIFSAHPASTRRGVSRSSRTWEAGSGGRSRMCSALCAGRHISSVRRNRAVPIPRRWDQALRDEHKATAANKPGTPRRSRISRQTIAQGTPVVAAALSLLACAKCTFLCTQGSRVRPASGVPCALYCWRDDVVVKLGQFVSRECESVSRRHCEERKRRSNPDHRGDGLDCFASLAMTSELP